MKESYLTTLRLTGIEVVPATAQTDFVRDAAGNLHANTPTGPQAIATASTVAAAIVAGIYGRIRATKEITGVFKAD
jgi:hypothetical protein